MSTIINNSKLIFLFQSKQYILPMCINAMSTLVLNLSYQLAKIGPSPRRLVPYQSGIANGNGSLSMAAEISQVSMKQCALSLPCV